MRRMKQNVKVVSVIMLSGLAFITTIVASSGGTNGMSFAKGLKGPDGWEDIRWSLDPDSVRKGAKFDPTKEDVPLGLREILRISAEELERVYGGDVVRHYGVDSITLFRLSGDKDGHTPWCYEVSYAPPRSDTKYQEGIRATVFVLGDGSKVQFERNRTKKSAELRGQIP